MINYEGNLNISDDGFFFYGGTDNDLDSFSIHLKYVPKESLKKMRIEYEVKKDFCYIYKNGKAISCKVPTQIINELKIFCVNNNIYIKELIGNKTKEMTLGKFLRISEIYYQSVSFGDSRAITRQGNRIIPCYLISPFSGVLIINNKSNKNKYIAYKYVIDIHNKNLARFREIEVETAMQLLKKFGNKKNVYKFNKEKEEEIKKNLFLEKI